MAKETYLYGKRDLPESAMLWRTTKAAAAAGGVTALHESMTVERPRAHMLL
jgi:hypothetical protein